MRIPPFIVTGIASAVGKINFVYGICFDHISARSDKPSALSPRPCIMITVAEWLPSAGKNVTVLVLLSRSILILLCVANNLEEGER